MPKKIIGQVREEARARLLTKALFVVVNRWKPAKCPKRAERGRLDQPGCAGTTQTELALQNGAVVRLETSEQFQVKETDVVGFTRVCHTNPHLFVTHPGSVCGFT